MVLDGKAIKLKMLWPEIREKSRSMGFKAIFGGTETPIFYIFGEAKLPPHGVQGNYSSTESFQGGVSLSQQAADLFRRNIREI